MSIHVASTVKIKEGSVAQNLNLFFFFLADGESNIDGGPRCGYVCYNFSHYCYHRQDLNQNVLTKIKCLLLCRSRNRSYFNKTVNQWNRLYVRAHASFYKYLYRFGRPGFINVLIYMFQ